MHLSFVAVSNKSYGPGHVAPMNLHQVQEVLAKQLFGHQMINYFLVPLSLTACMRSRSAETNCAVPLIRNP